MIFDEVDLHDFFSEATMLVSIVRAVCDCFLEATIPVSIRLIARAVLDFA